jgi:hypothetical protein
MNDLTDRRTSLRFRATLPISVEIQGRSVNAEIRDVSRGGLRVWSHHPVAIGDQLSIALPELGTRKARATWRGEGTFGVTFADGMLSDAEVTRLADTPAAIAA